MSPLEPRLLGVLVTFRRHEGLREVLTGLAEQTRPLDRLVVVDNAASPTSRGIVEEHGAQGHPVRYVDARRNLGSQGGCALGASQVLAEARDEDWIVLLDDDQPPDRPDLLERLLAFAVERRAADPRTACVGAVGARLDRRRGRTLRPRDDELAGPVPVDYVGNGHLPLYSVRAVRDVGFIHGEMFFGFGELELGIRLRRHGWTVYADGELTSAFRRRWGAWGVEVPQASRRIGGPPSWRQYYSLRNLIWLLRRHGHHGAAARVALLTGLAKPLVNLPRSPADAARHLVLNLRAVRDGYLGRLGKRLEPDLARYPS